MKNKFWGGGGSGAGNKALGFRVGTGIVAIQIPKPKLPKIFGSKKKNFFFLKLLFKTLHFPLCL